MLAEFRQFIEKFNVLPIAIGLVLATAFTPMVDATVNVLLSVIGAIFGASTSFDDLAFSLNGTPIKYGALIGAVVSFLLIAWVVFMIVKALNRLGARTDLAATRDQELLAEIRDALRSR